MKHQTINQEFTDPVAVGVVPIDAGQGAGQKIDENQVMPARPRPVQDPNDTRFSDPLIAQIVQTWRFRQNIVRAQTSLTLQAKALCRRFVEDGDKDEAEKLHAAILKGKDHPAAMIVLSFEKSRAAMDPQRRDYDNTMAKLGRRLPIVVKALEIKGIGYGTLATIVAELGDLSAYKSHSAVWKRAGLAVIDGERQGRRSNADEALRHGYSPARRSVFWNIGAALIKAQGKDDEAGPYRVIYDERKAYELANGHAKALAHNRAMRYMVKRLLRDLTTEWHRVNNARKRVRRT